MTAFVLWLAYALLIVLLLGALYWVYDQVTLPQPIKLLILGFVIVVGVIYCINSGVLPKLG